MSKILAYEHVLAPGILLLICLLIVSGCISPNQEEEKGYLEGTVSIGPLCPVEPCHLTEDQRAAVYAARQLLIVRERAFTQTVYKTGFSPDGHYNVSLPPGTYEVMLAKNGVDRSPDLPTQVSVSPGETVILNLSIDTGIR
jgi:hypothetical protein